MILPALTGDEPFFRPIKYFYFRQGTSPWPVAGGTSLNCRMNVRAYGRRANLVVIQVYILRQSERMRLPYYRREAHVAWEG
jgi:hypothetical protein